MMLVACLFDFTTCHPRWVILILYGLPIELRLLVITLRRDAYVLLDIQIMIFEGLI